MILQDKSILITGGTGSLGGVVLAAIRNSEYGKPTRVRIFSRDESKQHELAKLTKSYDFPVEYQLGDIRCYSSVAAALVGVDICVNAAALKHVPACENDPVEAVRTNVMGPNNIVRAIREHNLPVSKVLGISTDKACDPSSVMGMTKCLQERLLIKANVGKTSYNCIRYGNMLESRGSVVPLFRDQIATGGPVTVTHPHMTRFLVPLKSAAWHLISALVHTNPGEIYIPKMRSAIITDLARVMIGDKPIEFLYTGIRPGEKLDDAIISKSESIRTVEYEDYFIMMPPDSQSTNKPEFEYRSAQYANLMGESELAKLLGEANA